MTEALGAEGMALVESRTKDIFVAHDSHPHNYLNELDSSDAFVVRVADKLAVDKKVMESKQLKVIGRPGIGYDSVDVEAATAAGIPVVITPGANNRSVAEHAITLMMALSKNMVEADVEQRKGNWKIRDAKKAFEVEEKICLIIGLGTIGKIIAHLAQGLDMKVIGYDTFLTKEQMAEIGVEKYDDKMEAIKAADVVIVQMPLIDGVTNNTIDKAELDAMKKTLVDDEILHCPNVIVSPHSAAQTREAVIRMHTMCVKGCLAVIDGKKWPYVADKKVYEHPKWKDAEWAEV